MTNNTTAIQELENSSIGLTEVSLSEQLALHENNYQYLASLPNLDSLLLSVSFVIPVFNSEDSIRACLLSVLHQQRADLIREIIIVNDGSTDGSAAILERLQNEYDTIRIISNKTRHGAAYSRNRGIECATGDLVCFIDSDIILSDMYLPWHVAQHQHDNRCISFSLRTNIENENLINSTNPDTHMGDFRATLLAKAVNLQAAPFQFSTTHTLAEMCLTCAVTYHRDDLIKTNGCPENFVGWGYNDTAMAAKIIALGRSVVPLVEASVFHLKHEPRSGSVSRKWREFNKNKARYNRLLALPIQATFRRIIPEIEEYITY